jgi:hypothetical protein
MAKKILPKIGCPTDEEIHLLDYLKNRIADYIEQIRPLERRTILAALFGLTYLVCTRQTRCNLEEQLAEIDDFCSFMKKRAADEFEENQAFMRKFGS